MSFGINIHSTRNVTMNRDGYWRQQSEAISVIQLFALELGIPYCDPRLTLQKGARK
jgi:hypothetical protein